MSLTISCCTGLKKLTVANWPENIEQKRREFEEDLNEALIELRRMYEEIARAGNVPEYVEGIPRDLISYQNDVAKKLAAKKSLPEEHRDIIPNPLVAVAIDDDDLDRHPMLCTKAVRSSTNPIWKEVFEDFPLEMYLTGKAGIEMFENKNKNYRPQNLVFLVYHDSAIPEDDKAKPEEEEWKRDKPQRNHCIAKATWEWTDLCRSVGCAEFEKDLLLFNPNTHKKLGQDAKLTIKVRLCAPKMKHCNCFFDNLDKKVKEVHEQIVEHEELLDEPETIPKKIVRSKSKKNVIHGADCMCSTCTNIGFSKPIKSPRRRLRKKVRFAADLVRGAR